MVKIVVRSEEKKPEQVLELWLDTRDDEIILQARTRGDHLTWNLLTFKADGTIYRCSSLIEELGLDLDTDGRLKFTDD